MPSGETGTARHRRSRRIAGLVIAALGLLVSPFPGGPGPAHAASCNGQSHTLALQRGTVTPGSGSTSTSFRFSVEYLDNAGCPPTTIVLAVSGVGTFPLAWIATAADGAAIYGVARRLPAGRWAYTFSATSGEGSGTASVSLPGSPTPVVVTAPTPTPTATARPTSPPAVRPTPRPTGSAKATPRPSRSAVPGPTTSASPTSSPVVTASVRPTPGDQPSTSSSAPPVTGVARSGDDRWGGGGRGGSSEPGQPFDPAAAVADLLGAPIVPVVGGWLAASLVGCLVILFVLRRQPDRAVAIAPGTSDHAPPPPSWAESRGLALTSSAPDTPIEEATIPRWRRPSVQAARHSGVRAAAGTERAPLRFGVAAAGLALGVVDFRLVRVADRPDDLRSVEVGRLDRGDEVEILGRRPGWIHVRAPDGLDGWVPGQTIVVDSAPAAGDA
jgi:hypothetical protein